MKNRNKVKETESKKHNGKKKVIIISVCSALLVALLTVVTVGLVLYFNSPTYTATKLYKAVRDKDGEALAQLILPSEREYLDTLLSPVGVTVKELAEPIGEMLEKVDTGSFDTKYTRNGEKATYTVTPKDIGKMPSIDLTFKWENGKWYLAPAALTETLPIKTGLSLMESVMNSDGERFFDCIVPSAAREIRLVLKTLGMSEQDFLKEFVKDFDFSLEEGDLPTFTDIKYQNEKEAELTVELQFSEGESLTLVFVNQEGKWYLSLSNHILDFLKNLLNQHLTIPNLWENLFQNLFKK